MQGQAVNVKFEEWIKGGLNLYKENFGVIFPASLIAMLLTPLTFGLLAGPLWAGVVMIVLALIDRRDPKPEVGDVFQGFNLFQPAFLFVLGVGVAGMAGILVLIFVPFFGPVLSSAFALCLLTAVMFALYLIVDRKQNVQDAVKSSFETVQKSFFPFLGLFFVASLLSSLGVIACGIGVVVTLPILCCILGVAYRDVFGPGPSESGVNAEPADEAAPPPSAEPAPPSGAQSETPAPPTAAAEGTEPRPSAPPPSA